VNSISDPARRGTRRAVGARVLSLAALTRAGFAGSAQTAKTEKLHRQNYPT